MELLAAEAQRWAAPFVSNNHDLDSMLLRNISFGCNVFLVYDAEQSPKNSVWNVYESEHRGAIWQSCQMPG